MDCPERDFLDWFIENLIKCRWSINAQHTKKPTLFGTLFGNMRGYNSPKTIPNFTLCWGSLCCKFRRICQVEQKLLQANDCIYRRTSSNETHNIIQSQNILQSSKKSINPSAWRCTTRKCRTVFIHHLKFNQFKCAVLFLIVSEEFQI